jgi:glycine/D-amino acid oxidase-like deaminating enzyme
VVAAEVVGFGASGRNAGFVMTLFGLTMGLTGLRFGKQKAKEAHLYMERAVDYVGELVQKYHIDCEYERNGFLRVATTPAYAKRIQHEMELAHSLGITGIEWLDAEQTATRVRSPSDG